MHQRRAKDEVERLMAFLRDYCREHFATEERLMAAALYPERLQHARLHLEFERRFRVIERAIAERGPSAHQVLELKDLVRGWLVEHITKVDVRMAVHLRSAPAPRPRPGG